MSRIAAIDPASANGRARELLGAVEKGLGMVPNITRVMANQPAVLQGYLGFFDALSKGSFDARTREAIALTVAGANACGYCASAHAAISRSLKVEAGEIERRLGGTSGDPKLSAGLTFARALVAQRGTVSDVELAKVRRAGYSDAEIVEIVGNVAINLLTNYLNHVADTEIDFPVTEITNYTA